MTRARWALFLECDGPVNTQTGQDAERIVVELVERLILLGHCVKYATSIVPGGSGRSAQGLVVVVAAKERRAQRIHAAWRDCFTGDMEDPALPLWDELTTAEQDRWRNVADMLLAAPPIEDSQP